MSKAPRATAAQPALTAATIAMGLSAGLYFAFDVSVMPGLDRADDETYASAMNHINEAIENGFFGLVFFGAFLATGVAGGQLQRIGRRTAARWTWAALALYTAAVVLTMKINVPLNKRLAAGRTAAELAELRAKFKNTWVPSNAARTVACTAALICLGRALASSRH
ncbi:anthrone oxygenase family protein [Streptomyces sp. NPDC001941]|uniref:anthrone oxygenase family protein n=1 Tax=Streptomyces sp. NPDC001941 TaxID=3154659 RepID=UPI003316C96F